MRLHGALADAELVADLLVRAPGRDELQHFALARREIAVPLVVIGGSAAHAQAAELVEDAARNRWVDEREPIRDRADGVRQLLAAHFLEEVARRARAD